MTFVFNSGIPAAANNPSNDQPIMKANNVANEGIWDVDHVGFNVETVGGTHLQCTFTSNNVPTGTTLFPILFTNSSSQLQFFPPGNTALTGGQYTVASNFSTYLLAGLILKGGSITITGTPQTFTYTALSPALAAFFTNTYAVYLFPTNIAARGGSAYISGVTATTFTVTGGTNTATYYFLAIGN